VLGRTAARWLSRPSAVGLDGSRARPST
jgi:hypothetical protein